MVCCLKNPLDPVEQRQLSNAANVESCDRVTVCKTLPQSKKRLRKMLYLVSTTESKNCLSIYRNRMMLWCGSDIDPIRSLSGECDFGDRGFKVE